MQYQQESPILRNAFLAGAFELRNGIPEGASPKSSGPDLIKDAPGFTFAKRNKIEVKVKGEMDMYFVS